MSETSPRCSILAPNVFPPRQLTAAEIESINRIRWWHRIPIGLDSAGDIIYTPGECHHGVDGEDYFTRRFGIPIDLTGLDVLDIGGWDGLFSFEAVRRGAHSVTLIDASENEGGHWGGNDGLNLAMEIIQPRNMRFIPLSVMDLDPLTASNYDLVFFFGVFYHLKHPTVALERIATVTKPGGVVLTETAGNAMHPESKLKFMPDHEGDPTNFWYPTFIGYKLCCERLFGFRDCTLVYNGGGTRFTARMHRQ